MLLIGSASVAGTNLLGWCSKRCDGCCSRQMVQGHDSSSSSSSSSRQFCRRDQQASSLPQLLVVYLCWTAAFELLIEFRTQSAEKRVNIKWLIHRLTEVERQNSVRRLLLEKERDTCRSSVASRTSWSVKTDSNFRLSTPVVGLIFYRCYFLLDTQFLSACRADSRQKCVWDPSSSCKRHSDFCPFVSYFLH